MNNILINILSVIVTAVVLPLISIFGTQLIKFINSKIKNANEAKLLTTATTIVLNSTRCVFQTYVESLKKEGDFGLDAQKKALNDAKGLAVRQMTEEVKKYISSSYGDLDKWLTIQIESSINLLKKS